MDTNQLDFNEVLVKPEIINEWREACDEKDQDGSIKKIWRYHELWMITIVSNMHMKDLCKDVTKLENLYKLMSFMLNDQELFLKTFFYLKTNSIWKGPKYPEIHPVDISRFDFLNVKWTDEKQPMSTNNYWHVHILVQIVFRPIRGLTIHFMPDAKDENGNPILDESGKPISLLDQLTRELFNTTKKFYVNAIYEKNSVTTRLFYLDKNARGELK